jgi:hypothetical protein
MVVDCAMSIHGEFSDRVSGSAEAQARRVAGNIITIYDRTGFTFNLSKLRRHIRVSNT